MTPLDVQDAAVRRAGALCFGVAILAGLASLAVNFVLFLVVIFSRPAAGLLIALVALALELGVVPAIAMWARTRRPTVGRDVLVTACIAVTLGPLPFLLWMGVGALTAGR